ncbi:MAG: glycoside hydrolase family 127 protein [Xanthomonadales bacterium]
MTFKRLLLAIALLSCGKLLAIDYFPLDQVRLLDGPFRAAQDRNIDYLMALEPDRLLAPYLEEAGLEPRAEKYGNWESSGLGGHIGGHALTALSLAWAATGRTDVRERLDYMLRELRRAQLAHGNGYLGGVPDGDALWRDVAAGDVRADLFALNGSWVPWYNLHKVFAGLRDAWLYAGNPLARTMLIEWADWAAGLVANLDDAQMQAMLRAEHGGMNEVFADVAAITGDDRYLETARRFSHRFILDPLLAGEDRLTGLHANTQIPKVVGFERIAQQAGDADWHRAARFFWDTVVNERSVAIGGNSVREHFNDKHDFTPMIREVEGPETCNTYNMLKLTRLLFAAEPRGEYAEFYERALYNHILASQDPATGGLVYFTPMRPQHYRVYSQAQEAMWCCVGSGIENHVKYGAFIFAHDGGDLIVNLFIPARLEWPERGVALRQETRFPDESGTTLVFEQDSDVGLRLRWPSWAAADTPAVRINGRAQPATVGPDGYIRLQRKWKQGDRVSLALPMETRLEQMPDGLDQYAILYGPIVLAAKTNPFPGETLAYYADDSRMGHIASGPMCPLERTPVFVSDRPDFAGRIERIGDDELRFRFTGRTGQPGLESTELIPFFRLHHSRYVVYWPFSTPEQLAATRTLAAAEEAARLELDRLTVDEVAPGEQQPEAEHDFAGVDTEAGVNFGRHWRHAAGWFGYTLRDPQGEARYLRIDYWGADAGRTFTIEVNGIVIAEVTSTGAAGAEFVSVDYPLSEQVLARSTDGAHRLRFIAGEDSVAGGIYGVRLLRSLPDG